MNVPGRLLSPALNAAMTEGRYEHLEARALQRHLRPDDRVLELGAGCGFLSILAALVVGPEGVVAVEANPDLPDVIARNAAQNGVAGIDIRHGAVVAGKASTQSFFLRGAFWAGSTDERHVKDVEVTVPALGFGTLCREMRPTIIVADLEGGERHLFDEGVIDSVRVIVMELHENRYGQDGIRALFDRLSEAGFAYDPNGSRGKVVVFRRADE